MGAHVKLPGTQPRPFPQSELAVHGPPDELGGRQAIMIELQIRPWAHCEVVVQGAQVSEGEAWEVGGAGTQWPWRQSYPAVQPPLGQFWQRPDRQKLVSHWLALMQGAPMLPGAMVAAVVGEGLGGGADGTTHTLLLLHVAPEGQGLEAPHFWQIPRLQ